MCLSNWDGMFFNHSWLRHSWLKIIPSRLLRHFRATTREGNLYHHLCYARNVPFLKVQRAEDTCHVMSKTLHLCWEHLNFRAVFEAAEELLRKAKKKCGDTEKNKEKLEANCTGFSAEFFGSQSVEMFCFARKTKIQMLTASWLSLISLGLSFLK